MSDVEAEALSLVEPLAAHHVVDSFECGTPPLDQFLQRFALVNQKTGSARTYVVCRGLRVVGYYSLVVGAVEHARAPVRVGKGLPRHPIPVMLLARLGGRRKRTGSRIGSRALLKECSIED